MIKKHEAFEKAAAAQEERFAALERLTTVRITMFDFSYTVKDFQNLKILRPCTTDLNFLLFCIEFSMALQVKTTNPCS